MKVIDLELPGLKLIELKVFGDERGFFVERFNESLFKDNNLPTHYVQDNHSRSAPGVLRGLHYQYDPPQRKLIGVTRGRIWDVVLDIRKDSPTFLKHFGVEISSENGRLLFVPVGFAHGFCVLGDQPADVLYKVDTPYNPKGEAGIMWDDPELAILWPLKDPVISDRDKKLQPVSQFKATLK